MSSQLKGNAVVGQSGGPTAVINQSLVGVIQGVKECGHIDQLLGAKYGVQRDRRRKIRRSEKGQRGIAGAGRADAGGGAGFDAR